MNARPWPYPAPLDDGGASHLAGSRFPDVALAATTGARISVASLDGRAVVYAYTWTGRHGLASPPAWDEIPGAHGSTPESEGFRDLYPAFRARFTEVLGLSTQDEEHQREFAGRLALPFALLSDARLALARALRLPTFTTGGVTYLKRLTMVACDGVIERVFYPVHPPDRHAREVLDWLERS